MAEILNALVDSETPLVINPVTKSITIPEGYNTMVGVVNEHNSNKITFQCPATIEGQSLLGSADSGYYTTVNCVIKWQNSKTKGTYLVTDLAVLEADSNTVQFSWVLDREALSAKGGLSFSVNFVILNRAELVVFKWSTVTTKGFTIGDSLYISAIDDGETTETEITKLISSTNPLVSLVASAGYIGVTLKNKTINFYDTEESSFSTVLGQAYDGASRKIEIQFLDALPDGVTFDDIDKKLIKWNNINGKFTGCSELEEDTIDGVTKYYWTVPKELTSKAGKVSIQFCFIAFDEDDTVKYAWGSFVNSGLSINESIYVEGIDINYYDLLSPTNFKTFVTQNVLPVTSLKLFGSNNIAPYKFYKTTGPSGAGWTCTVEEKGTIGAHAFESSTLTKLIGLPRVLETSAFSGCTKLTEINLKLVDNWNSYCLSETAISAIDIPTGVSSLPNGVFSSCTNLQTIIIPENITIISDFAFRNCTSLTSITCKATTPPSINTYTFQNVPADCAIFVPAETVELYKNATNWADRGDYIQAIE